MDLGHCTCKRFTFLQDGRCSKCRAKARLDRAEERVSELEALLVEARKERRSATREYRSLSADYRRTIQNRARALVKKGYPQEEAFRMARRYAELSAPDAILTILATNGNDWVSVPFIAEETGLSNSYLYGLCLKMLAQGILETTYEKLDGKIYSVCYRKKE